MALAGAHRRLGRPVDHAAHIERAQSLGLGFGDEGLEKWLREEIEKVR